MDAHPFRRKASYTVMVKGRPAPPLSWEEALSLYRLELWLAETDPKESLVSVVLAEGTRIIAAVITLKGEIRIDTRLEMTR